MYLSPTTTRNLQLFLFLSITILATFPVLFLTPVHAGASENPTVGADLKGIKVPLKTDDEVAERESMAMNPEGLSVAEKKTVRRTRRKTLFRSRGFTFNEIDHQLTL